MQQPRLAACLLAALVILPAYSQQNQQNPQPTDTPCPPDTTKAKIKRGLGSLLKNTPLGQTVAGQGQQTQPCTNPPEKKTTDPAGPVPQPTPTAASNPPAAATAPNPTSTLISASPPPALPDNQQPKPGTTRRVKYNGQDIAIMTITDEDSRPSTHIIIPGIVRPPVKLTANPDVYVSVNTPPTIYTVKDGVLTIQEPTKEIPPDMQYSFADAFGGRPSGRATGEGATITWEQLHSGVHAGLNVFAFKNGGSCSGQAVGQNAQGEYVKFQCVIYGYFVVSGNSFHKVDALPADLKRHVTGEGPQ